MNIAPLAIQKFFDSNGNPLVGGQLFVYENGTSTKAQSYSDEAGTLNTNPVILDYRGECRLWLDPEKSYKLVLSPPWDADPPTSPIWTADNIVAAATLADITPQFIGQSLWPRTAAEVSASIIPVAYNYPGPLPQRYGANGLGGAADDLAMAAIAAVGGNASGLTINDPDKSYRMVAAVIRNDGGGWQFINDADHVPVGFDSVSVVGESIRVTYSFDSTKVYSLVVGLDETMSSQGVFCGPSVGLQYSDIKIYMPFSCWVEKTSGSFVFGDIPVFLGAGTSTTIATDPDESAFTITHQVASEDQPPVATVLTSGTGDPPGYEIRLNYGGTTIEGVSYSDFCGFIYYDGSSWVVETDNIDVPTVSFNAGVLTVSHEKLPASNQGVNITSVSGIYLPALGTVITDTSFQVSWLDYDGDPVNTENANMKVRYHRPVRVRSKAPDGMRVSVQRGPVILNPEDIVSLNGNFWILGLLAP